MEWISRWNTQKLIIFYLKYPNYCVSSKINPVSLKRHIIISTTTTIIIDHFDDDNWYFLFWISTEKLILRGRGNRLNGLDYFPTLKIRGTNTTWVTFEFKCGVSIFSAFLFKCNYISLKLLTIKKVTNVHIL